MVLRKISTCILFVAIASYGAIAQEQLTISQHDVLSELENNLEDSVVEMGNFEVDGLYYKIVSPNAVKVVKAHEGHEYEGDIVIPSSITYDSKDYTVTQVDSAAFMRNTAIVSVKIPSTVTALEECTFKFCTSLKSVSLPDVLVEVPQGLCSNCTSLTTVNFPTSLKAINDYAFIYTALTEAILPDGITHIGKRAFYQTPYLEKLHLPASLVTVSDQAFVTWSEVVSVDSNILPETLENVGTAAFYGLVDWNGTHSIVLPKSLSYIGNGAFAFCKFGSGTLSEGNQHFCISDNMLLDKAKTRLLIMFNDGNTQKTIPEGVTLLDMGCGGCDSSMEQLVLPSTLDSIGYFAFLECFKLKDITVKATTPPLCGEREGYHPFNDSFTTATLHVPAGCTDAYKEAETWKKFQTITDVETAIGGIRLAPLSVPVRYDLGGRKLPLQKDKGLYIENGKVHVK